MFSTIWSKQSKLAVGMAAGFLFLVLLPLMIIAHFNYPCSDDFSFAGAIYREISNNSDIKRILQGAWEEAMQYYQNWQGCYFNNVLSSFGIGVAMPRYYYLGTYLVLILFVLASISFGRTITRQVCRWDSDISWICSILITAMQMLYAPYPSEAFYWYVGATVYTMTYALQLFLCIALICFYRAKDNKERILFGIVAIFLAFMIGGSNYTTGLLTAELLALAFLVMLLFKKRCYFLGVILLEYLLCFVKFNALAPGNATRMGAVKSLGAIGSIVASFKQGAVFLKEWFRLPVVLFLMVILLLGISQVAKMEFSFRLPGLVTTVSFGLFCSMMTPPFFAGATWGPGRLINLVYFSYYFLLAGNLLYWIGWAVHKYERLRLTAQKEVSVLPILLCYFILLFVCLKIYGLQSASSSSALLSLVKGEAAQYLKENELRWEIYTDDAVKDVEVDDFSVKPYVLYHDDIVEDKTDWRNNSVAAFFGKDSVGLKR